MWLHINLTFTVIINQSSQRFPLFSFIMVYIRMNVYACKYVVSYWLQMCGMQFVFEWFALFQTHSGKMKEFWDELYAHTIHFTYTTLQHLYLYSAYIVYRTRQKTRWRNVEIKFELKSYTELDQLLLKPEGYGERQGGINIKSWVAVPTE